MMIWSGEQRFQQQQLEEVFYSQKKKKTNKTNEKCLLFNGLANDWPSFIA